MTNKDLLSLTVFIVVMFSLLFIATYFLNQPRSVAPDFIELPQAVRINPELK